MNPSNHVTKSSVRRSDQPLGACCVCERIDSHKYFDDELSGPVCKGCVLPLIAAEEILQKHEASKRKEPSRRDCKPGG